MAVNTKNIFFLSLIILRLCILVPLPVKIRFLGIYDAILILHLICILWKLLWVIIPVLNILLVLLFIVLILYVAKSSLSLSVINICYFNLHYIDTVYLKDSAITLFLNILLLLFLIPVNIYYSIQWTPTKDYIWSKMAHILETFSKHFSLCLVSKLAT
jgi:uncharacterized membrane protein YjgN (DUF898 family)